ncbi:MAG: T9SS type A sorting domain-containing protein [Bacteroidetes bacterium]|nr:T9SS type A sorting domain-containing protein [Bacteroidota bacterium]
MKRKLSILIILISLFFILQKTNAQYTYDSVSFETRTSKIIIDTTGNNIWQIGTPDKVFFDAAHSGEKTILTDSVNSYPLNDTSSFIYVIRNPYTETCFTSMEFWHKYDMDTLTDNGIIEASYDGGNSWVIVNDTSEVSPWGSFFWWDNDYHAMDGNYTAHPLTTTGKSDGWILSRFNWEWWIPVKSDTIIYPLDSLMIKFTFTSDSIETNRDGWMIDDILTASAEWQLCSDITEISDSNNFSAYPNPFSKQTRIEYKRDIANSKIIIYNSTGLKVRQDDNTNGQSTIVSRDNLPSGIYYLVIVQNEKIIGKIKLLIID